MHVRVVQITVRIVLVRAKALQAGAVHVDAQGVAGGDEGVEPDVELAAGDEHRAIDVSLNNAKFCRRVFILAVNEVDAAAAAGGRRFHDPELGVLPGGI